MDQPYVGLLGLLGGTTRLLVCRDAGEAQTLPVLWHPGFAIICQDSLLARLRSLGQWGRPLSYRGAPRRPQLQRLPLGRKG